MSQPTPGDVYVSAPLGNISLSYVQDQSMSIADQLFPVVPVQQQSGIVWEWDMAYMLKNGMKVRAPNAESEGIGNKLNKRTYAAIVEALHHDIPDQRRANEVSPIDSDRAATVQLTQQAWQRREITLKNKLFAAGQWSAFPDTTGTTGTPGANQIKQWDLATSTPVKDITTMSTAAKLTTGVRPNTLAMGRPVWDALMYNPDIIDRIKYSSSNGTPTLVTRDAVAALFGVKRILVSDVVQTVTNEGAAVPVNQFVIGKEILFGYVPDAPGLDTPSMGYTFAWSGYLGANAYGARMKKFRMENLASDRIEIEQAYDQIVLGPALAGYISGVVS